MELKFVATKKPVTDDPVVQRRQRLGRRIGQQTELLRNANDGMLPRTSWLWMDEKGAYFLPIKYGRQLIELKKGMFAVQCEGIEHAANALATIRTMVLQGSLDGQLTISAGQIRQKFLRG